MPDAPRANKIQTPRMIACPSDRPCPLSPSLPLPLWPRSGPSWVTIEVPLTPHLTTYGLLRIATEQGHSVGQQGWGAQEADGDDDLVSI